MLRLKLSQGLERGRFMKPVTLMHAQGVPVNVEAVEYLRRNGPEILRKLIETVDKDYGVFVDAMFKEKLYANWITAKGLADIWSKTPGGQFAHDKETRKQMCEICPEFAPLSELLGSRSQLKQNKLLVGSDGRNRTSINPYRTVTGRCAPSNSEGVFGLPSWLRNLVRPTPGHALIYADYEQQEFAIAAKLSGDQAMLEAYLSGDPYMALAIRAGAAPNGATKKTHPRIRENFKSVVLGLQYGMGPKTLAMRIGCPVSKARELIAAHKRIFWKFWQWSDAVLAHVRAHRELLTKWGWPIQTPARYNQLTFRNYPMQAHGADLLRHACSMLTDAGIKVCWSIHDAFLIEAKLKNVDQVVGRSRQIMAHASARLFDGMEIRTEVTVIRYPNHYCDPRGEHMRKVVADILGFDVFSQMPPVVIANPSQGELFDGITQVDKIDSLGRQE
jgi:hypothetical protein